MPPSQASTLYTFCDIHCTQHWWGIQYRGARHAGAQQPFSKLLEEAGAEHVPAEEPAARAHVLLPQRLRKAQPKKQEAVKSDEVLILTSDEEDEEQRVPTTDAEDEEEVCDFHSRFWPFLLHR